MLIFLLGLPSSLPFLGNETIGDQTYFVNIARGLATWLRKVTNFMATLISHTAGEEVDITIHPIEGPIILGLITLI